MKTFIKKLSTVHKVLAVVFILFSQFIMAIYSLDDKEVANNTFNIPVLYALFMMTAVIFLIITIILAVYYNKEEKKAKNISEVIKETVEEKH